MVHLIERLTKIPFGWAVTLASLWAIGIAYIAFAYVFLPGPDHIPFFFEAIFDWNKEARLAA